MATGWAIFANNLRLDARRGMFSVEGREQVVVQWGDEFASGLQTFSPIFLFLPPT